MSISEPVLAASVSTELAELTDGQPFLDRVKASIAQQLALCDKRVAEVQNELMLNDRELMAATARLEQQHRDDIERAEKILANARALAANGHAIEDARIRDQLRQEIAVRDTIKASADRLSSV